LKAGPVASEIGGTLELKRGANRPPLVAHAIPLAESCAASVFDIGCTAATVFVANPAACLNAPAA